MKAYSTLLEENNLNNNIGLEKQIALARQVFYK